MNESIKSELIKAQRNEITEQAIYTHLAKTAKESENRTVLLEIGGDEKKHYDILKTYTDTDVSPNRFRIFFYTLLAKILGLSFALRLMEKNEHMAKKDYGEYVADIPAIAELQADEEEHEQKLISMLEDERLKYAGSVVLGLNDALVELTGAIAGYTLALRSTRLIAVVALITGISAALSMGASEYLSTKSDEETTKHPVKASIYTGGAYIIAVFILVAPFLIVPQLFLALGWTLLNALLLILAFTYYISIARGDSFRKSAAEMILISMGVAALSFGIGLVVRTFLGVDG